jgi:hypothetical protein
MGMHADVGEKKQIEIQSAQHLSGDFYPLRQSNDFLAARVQPVAYLILYGGGEVDDHHIKSVAIKMADQPFKGACMAMGIEKS